MNAFEEQARRLRRALVDELVAEGALRSPSWRDAFAAVPRHAFLPGLYRDVDGGGYGYIDGTRPETREEWLRLTYTDEPWVTQLRSTSGSEDGDNGAREGTPTSSSSAPGLMARMLEALEVADGHRVLEAGTGTGYGAALLAERLGDDRVVTVEADPELAATARRHLADVGHRPTVVAGDGDHGYPPAGPYDRVLATYGVPEVPRAWIEQTKPGGALVVPLYSPLPAGLMARLTVVGGGQTQGRFLRDFGGFMPTRGLPALQATTSGADPDRERPTPVPAGALWSVPPWLFLATLLLPSGLAAFMSVADGQPLQHWLTAPDSSWAYQYETDDGRTLAAEGGPQRLWSRLEQAQQLWAELGEPPRERFGLTVTPDRRVVWFGSPDGPCWEPSRSK